MNCKLPLALLALLALARPAAAHPSPFSFIDLRIGDRSIAVTIVAHVFDLAHDLNVAVPEQLLDPAVVASRNTAIAALFASRLHIDANGRTLRCTPVGPAEIVGDRQAVSIRFDCPASAASSIGITAVLFPYDPVHQTFVNVYDQSALRAQTILDGKRPRFEYFASTPQGVVSVVAKFVRAGVHHILIGPDHLLFLVGLLLLGGSIRRLALIVTAFTAAHSLTLSLAALNVVTPPARLIEPAIALSIVYVGADNLLAGSGRDMRAWIAFAFGFIHGFGFANVLREMDLPRAALGWSLFSFNVGVEIGQLAVVLVVASALAAVRKRSPAANRLVVRFGSLGVMAAGACWFVQRVFFPGGWS